MKKYFNINLPAFVLLLVVAIGSGGCRENTLINSKVSPSKNQLGVKDTVLRCITHTFYDDTAQTSTNLSGVPMYQVVGTGFDPFFGTMTGATFFQVIPFITSDTFFTDNQIDSAILVLPYSGFTYGDTSNTTATQTYQVFYMTDTLALNSVLTPYYSYNTRNVDLSFPLSDPYTINVHKLQDSFYTTGVLAKNYPGLRIPIKLNALKNHLLGAQSAMHNSVQPLTDFIKNFNGICVRTADSRISSPSVPYFQLDGSDVYSEAGILVYYHKNGTTPDTSMIAPYYFNTQICSHYNAITKSYRNSPVNRLFTSTQPNDSIVALQCQPGASIDVLIPGLTHLPEGVISKAELQLSILPNSYYNPSNYQLPEKIYPEGVGSGTYPGYGILPGLQYIISDYFPTGSTSPLAVLDGYVHNMSRGGKNILTYTVDIPREVMTSIKAKNDTLHLRLHGTLDLYGAFHLVAGGGTYSDSLYRPRLFVVYSKLN